jgi:2-polyprenyl-3-methyl-5-hydroxy-6-metoxy-1,4-benzoquinol methylase
MKILNNKKTEQVEACPCCMSSKIEIHAKSIKDILFKSSELNWDISKCKDCKSLFLSTRYREEYISEAYAQYYTHKSEDSSNTFIRKLLIKKYIRLIFIQLLKKNNFFSNLLNSIVDSLFKVKKNQYDRDLRFLQKISTKKNLLDIGCGNGDFLLIAEELGYKAFGIDTDPKAYHQAQKKIKEVKLGSIDKAKEFNILFDVITISHVLEHVYDIHYLIKSCSSLLNKDGKIFIEYPNPNSYCSLFFQESWRGLEPPRHIALPTINALTNILSKNGFAIEKQHSTISAFNYIYSQSFQISSVTPIKESKDFEKIKSKFKQTNYVKDIARHEFIALTAIKI